MGGMMGGMMGGGGKGGGSGNTGADAFFAQQALGQNEQAIHNRYAQLGIGIPGSGQSAQSAAASGGSLTAGGPSTMEQQDIGTIPTETGGAMGMADALMGQTFNPVNAAGLGPGGPIDQLAQQNANQEQAGFGAATGGFGQSTNQVG